MKILGNKRSIIKAIYILEEKTIEKIIFLNYSQL